VNFADADGSGRTAQQRRCYTERQKFMATIGHVNHLAARAAASKRAGEQKEELDHIIGGSPTKPPLRHVNFGRFKEKTTQIFQTFANAPNFFTGMAVRFGTQVRLIPGLLRSQTAMAPFGVLFFERNLRKSSDKKGLD
jgi:hypothetical protein